MTDQNPEKLNFVNNTSTFCIAKGDTGATSHYWTENDKGILENIKKDKGHSVQLPDSTMISSTEQGELPLSNLLSTKATKTAILPKLKSANLISLGQLCDDGCTITLDQDTMKVTKNNTTILKGIRNQKDGLWDIPISKKTITKIAVFNRPYMVCCIKRTLQSRHLIGIMLTKNHLTKMSFPNIYNH